MSTAWARLSFHRTFDNLFLDPESFYAMTICYLAMQTVLNILSISEEFLQPSASWTNLSSLLQLFDFRCFGRLISPWAYLLLEYIMLLAIGISGWRLVASAKCSLFCRLTFHLIPILSSTFLRLNCWLYNQSSLSDRINCLILFVVYSMLWLMYTWKSLWIWIGKTYKVRKLPSIISVVFHIVMQFISLVAGMSESQSAASIKMGLLIFMIPYSIYRLYESFRLFCYVNPKLYYVSLVARLAVFLTCISQVFMALVIHKFSEHILFLNLLLIITLHYSGLLKTLLFAKYNSLVLYFTHLRQETQLSVCMFLLMQSLKHPYDEYYRLWCSVAQQIKHCHPPTSDLKYLLIDTYIKRIEEMKSIESYIFVISLLIRERRYLKAIKFLCILGTQSEHHREEVEYLRLSIESYSRYCKQLSMLEDCPDGIICHQINNASNVSIEDMLKYEDKTLQLITEVYKSLQSQIQLKRLLTVLDNYKLDQLESAIDSADNCKRTVYYFIKHNKKYLAYARFAAAYYSFLTRCCNLYYLVPNLLQEYFRSEYDGKHLSSINNVMICFVSGENDSLSTILNANVTMKYFFSISQDRINNRLEKVDRILPSTIISKHNELMVRFKKSGVSNVLGKVRELFVVRDNVPYCTKAAIKVMPSIYGLMFSGDLRIISYKSRFMIIDNKGKIQHYSAELSYVVDGWNAAGPHWRRRTSTIMSPLHLNDLMIQGSMSPQKVYLTHIHIEEVEFTICKLTNLVIKPKKTVISRSVMSYKVYKRYTASIEKRNRALDIEMILKTIKPSQVFSWFSRLVCLTLCIFAVGMSAIYLCINHVNHLSTITQLSIYNYLLLSNTARQQYNSMNVWPQLSLLSPNNNLKANLFTDMQSDVEFDRLSPIELLPYNKIILSRQLYRSINLLQYYSLSASLISELQYSSNPAEYSYDLVCTIPNGHIVDVLKQYKLNLLSYIQLITLYDQYIFTSLAVLSLVFIISILFGLHTQFHKQQSYINLFGSMDANCLRYSIQDLDHTFEFLHNLKCYEVECLTLDRYSDEIDCRLNNKIELEYMETLDVDMEASHSRVNSPNVYFRLSFFSSNCPKILMLLLLMLPISMTFYTSNMFCTKVNGNASGYLEQAEISLLITDELTAITYNLIKAANFRSRGLPVTNSIIEGAKWHRLVSHYNSIELKLRNMIPWEMTEYLFYKAICHENCTSLLKGSVEQGLIACLTYFSKYTQEIMTVILKDSYSYGLVRDNLTLLAHANNHFINPAIRKLQRSSLNHSMGLRTAEALRVKWLIFSIAVPLLSILTVILIARFSAYSNKVYKIFISAFRYAIVLQYCVYF